MSFGGKFNLNKTRFLVFNLMVILGILGGQNAVQAKVFVYEHSENIPLSVNRIVEVLMDVENTCKEGCRYYVSSVDETRLLEEEARPNDGRSLVIWRLSRAQKTIKTFNKVFLKKTDNGMEITFEMPTVSEISNYENRHDLVHDDIFSSLKVTWTINKNAVDGESNLNYRFYGKADGFAARLFAHLINKGIRTSAHDIFTVLKEI